MEHIAKNIHRRSNVNVGERLEVLVDLSKGDNPTSLMIDSLGYQRVSVHIQPEGNAGTGNIALKQGNIKNSSLCVDLDTPINLITTSASFESSEIAGSYLALQYAGGGTGKFKVFISLSR